MKPLQRKQLKPTRQLCRSHRTTLDSRKLHGAAAPLASSRTNDRTRDICSFLRTYSAVRESTPYGIYRHVCAHSFDNAARDDSDSGADRPLKQSAMAAILKCH
jgi:hypothetical protein